MFTTVLLSLLALTDVQRAQATISDTAKIQFTVQAAVVDGTPAFIFGAADIEKCPLRFLYHPGPLEQPGGASLQGFEITILQDETCLTRVTRAWNEAYEAMEQRGAIDRIYDEASKEYAQAVALCLQLRSEYAEKYRGRLEQMNDDERKQFEGACLTELPENVVNERLLNEPEAQAWRAQWKGPLGQTLSLGELRAFFDGKPVVPEQEIQRFLSEDHSLRFQLRAYDGGKDDMPVYSAAIKFTDLPSEEAKTIYNRYDPDLETISIQAEAQSSLPSPLTTIRSNLDGKW